VQFYFCNKYFLIPLTFIFRRNLYGSEKIHLFNNISQAVVRLHDIKLQLPYIQEISATIERRKRRGPKGLRGHIGRKFLPPLSLLGPDIGAVAFRYEEARSRRRRRRVKVVHLFHLFLHRHRHRLSTIHIHTTRPRVEFVRFAISPDGTITNTRSRSGTIVLESLGYKFKRNPRA